MIATVKFYHLDKGWGFLVDETGIEHFVHKANLIDVDRLYKSQTVEFECIKTIRGSMAVNVKVKEVSSEKQ